MYGIRIVFLAEKVQVFKYLVSTMLVHSAALYSYLACYALICDLFDDGELIVSEVYVVIVATASYHSVSGSSDRFEALVLVALMIHTF